MKKKVFVLLFCLFLIVYSVAFANTDAMTCCYNDGGFMYPHYSGWYKILSYYADDGSGTRIWLIARDKIYQCNVNSSHVIIHYRDDLIRVPEGNLGQYGL